jgi:nucleotide-binding universal stress UspA family protein
MTDPIRKIVVATDLSERGDVALARAFALAATHAGALTAIYVIDDVLPEPAAAALRNAASDLIARRMNALAKDGGASPSAIHISVERGRSPAVIAETCERLGADLFVVGAHRGDPIWGALHGATVYRAITLAETPALVARTGGAVAPERIVAAIDFSIASERALELAQAIYPAARIMLLHALDLVKSAFIPGNAAERYRAQAQARAQAELAAYARRTGIEKKLDGMLVDAGEPSEVILRHAALLGAGVVAMGTHGRTGVGHALLGSVAAALVERGRSDLLIVRAW